MMKIAPKFMSVLQTTVTFAFLAATNVFAENVENPIISEKPFNSEQYSNSPKLDINKAVSQPNQYPNNPLNLKLPPANNSLDKTKVTNHTPLGITDIRKKSLENNLQIKALLIDPKIAEQQVRKEQAKFDKTLFLYAKYAEKNLPEQSGDNLVLKSLDANLDKKIIKISTINQEKRVTELEAGMKIPLSTGGSVTVAIPNENVVSRSAFNSDESRSALRFSFSQPLLRNAGKKVNEASILIAQADQRSTSARSKLLALRILATTDKAYWRLYEAWSVLDIRQQQYDYANRNLNMVKQRVNAGISAAIEINRAEIGVADRLEALIVANTQRVLAERQLKFYLNELDEPPENSKPIILTTQPNLTYFELDRQQLLEAALAQRLELLEMELKLSADLIKIDYLHNQTLPLFTLDYQYGALSSSENSYSNSISKIGDYNDWSIGLKFEMPWTNEAAKSNLESAVQQRLQRLSNQTLQKMNVKKEILDAADVLEQDWQRIIAARRQVLIAGKNYDAELKQFNEGLRSMTEVLETLTKLGEAQIKEVNAIKDYQNAQIDIAYATGTLFGFLNTATQ
jgi:outer membrane protein